MATQSTQSVRQAPAEASSAPIGKQSEALKRSLYHSAETEKCMARPATTPLGYRFSPFERIGKEIFKLSVDKQRAAKFAMSTMDVSTGLKTLVELLDWDADIARFRSEEDDPSTAPAPILNEFHRGALQRLVYEVLDRLVDDAESHVECFKKEIEAIKAPKVS